MATKKKSLQAISVFVVHRKKRGFGSGEFITRKELKLNPLVKTYSTKVKRKTPAKKAKVVRLFRVLERDKGLDVRPPQPNPKDPPADPAKKRSSYVQKSRKYIT
jgi:hypothetical protein